VLSTLSVFTLLLSFLLLLHGSCQSKVRQFHIESSVEQHVASLHIAVNDGWTGGMKEEQTFGHLHRHIEQHGGGGQLASNRGGCCCRYTVRGGDRTGLDSRRSSFVLLGV